MRPRRPTWVADFGTADTVQGLKRVGSDLRRSSSASDLQRSKSEARAAVNNKVLLDRIHKHTAWA